MSDQLLDDSSISNHTVDISFKHGYTFSVGARIAVGILGGIGFFMILAGGAGYIIGPIPFILGSFALTSYQGTDICYRTKYIREYDSRFFIKTGKWKSTKTYPDICILKLGRSNKFGDGSKDEVYLMTKRHRKRILLRICNNVEHAQKTANFLAEKLDKEVKPFKPAISSRTKARLRYRK